MSRYILCFLLLISAAVPPCRAEENVFSQVDGSLPMRFPESHGAHPDYSTEWWYFVGHLDGAQDRTYGFELTFFRIGLDPKTQSRSRWRHHSLYLTHFALTDDHQQRFFHDERTSRGVFDQAGAHEGRLEVWNGPWKAVLNGEVLHLAAESRDFAVDLRLSSTKPAVLHGRSGLSQKGPGPGQASYYSSFTRLQGSGTIRVEGELIPLQKAQAWMDHEVTSAGLPDNIEGWDWFAIQLENGEEFMLYQLRTKAGKKDLYSKGSFIQKDGTVISLKHDDYTIEPLGTWKSPNSGTVYPSGWKILVKKTGHEFEITPTVRAQELLTQKSTGVNYWEGRCKVEGSRAGHPVTGSAYAELTGYDKALTYS